MAKRWFLVGIILVLVLFLLGGCGIPQEQYDAKSAQLSEAQTEQQTVMAELAASQAKVSELTSSLEKGKADLETTQADLESTEADLEIIQDELAEIKEVYPPRDFSSLTELQNWLYSNDASEKPGTKYAEDWIRLALELQQDALADGYVVSVDYDSDEEDVTVWCTTIINGRVFYWDPETDDVEEDTSLATVK